MGSPRFVFSFETSSRESDGCASNKNPQNPSKSQKQKAKSKKQKAKTSKAKAARASWRQELEQQLHGQQQKVQLAVSTFEASTRTRPSSKQLRASCIQFIQQLRAQFSQFTLGSYSYSQGSLGRGSLWRPGKLPCVPCVTSRRLCVLSALGFCLAPPRNQSEPTCPTCPSQSRKQSAGKGTAYKYTQESQE